jgi:ABC-type transporter Mla subunit MlaD
MSGPNGPDIAAVYQLLTQVARTVTGHDRKLDDLSAEVAGLREVVAAHDRKLDDLSSGLASLRDAVTHYHSSVLGHGLLISELDERVRRIERHLKLEPAAAEAPAHALKSDRGRGDCSGGRGR